jgi:hypothetical protein
MTTYFNEFLVEDDARIAFVCNAFKRLNDDKQASREFIGGAGVRNLPDV